jgi:hypothetical protein
VAFLNFPEDRIVGTLGWIGSYSEQTGPVLATGTVEVPDDQRIGLRVGEILGAEPQPGGGWSMFPAQRPDDLIFLERLPGDAIDSLGLHFRVIPSSLASVVHLAPGLTHLSLGFTRLNDGILHYVAQLRRLRILQTFGNRFTDSGVQQLAGLTSLEHLSLEEESLTIAAFDFVSRLPNLQSLGVWDVDMTEDEHAELRARVPAVDLGPRGRGSG